MSSQASKMTVLYTRTKIWPIYSDKSYDIYNVPEMTKYLTELNERDSPIEMVHTRCFDCIQLCQKAVINTETRLL